MALDEALFALVIDRTILLLGYRKSYRFPPELKDIDDPAGTFPFRAHDSAGACTNIETGYSTLLRSTPSALMESDSTAPRQQQLRFAGFSKSPDGCKPSI